MLKSEPYLKNDLNFELSEKALMKMTLSSFTQKQPFSRLNNILS